jgi:hypothetical protein
VTRELDVVHLLDDASVPELLERASLSPDAVVVLRREAHLERRPRRTHRGDAHRLQRRPPGVLRLVVLDGVMEMRFCGARVRLSPLVA